MTPRERLIVLGNSLGEPGDPHRELLIQAAYDLNILAQVGNRLLPSLTRKVQPVKDALERWK